MKIHQQVKDGIVSRINYTDINILYECLDLNWHHLGHIS
jgi:hypothetical protein